MRVQKKPSRLLIPVNLSLFGGSWDKLLSSLLAEIPRGDSSLSDRILVRGVRDEVRRWMAEERKASVLTQNAFVLGLLDEAFERRNQLALPLSPAPPQPISGQAETLPFRFIDLFAGIGGMRVGLSRIGGECVFTSEWDKYAQRTYKAWYEDPEPPHGDIRKIPIEDIPEHDILAAGFPCQPFSIAGVSKKKSLGREHGFRDVTQGTLFFHLASIIEIKRPPVLILENVKNLMSHDSGRTWDVIKSTLEEMEYSVFPQVVDAAHFVPQHRERVIIVGFDQREFGRSIMFKFPDLPEGPKPKLREILDPNPPDKYTLTDHLWQYLQDYAERHRQKGNGFGFGLADLDGVSRTLSARYHKDGSEILIPQRRKNPRRLTPAECARLMGFPVKPQVVSDTQAYRQFGNAVVPAVIEWVGRAILDVMRRHVGSRGPLIKRSA
jgi:DNA (cytosine-5)-methyltransferase 1